MNIKKNFSLPVLLSFIASAVLFVGVLTVFRACAQTDEGMWMNCHYVELALAAIGIAATVITFLNMILIRKIKTKIIFTVLVFILSVIAILLPGRLVSMCMMDTMRCHMLMRPAVDILCVLFIIIELIGIFFINREGKAA